MPRTVLPWTGVSKTPDQVGTGRRPIPCPLFHSLPLETQTGPISVENRNRQRARARFPRNLGKEATSFNQDGVRAKLTGHERDLGVTGSDADDIDSMHARFYNGQIARFLGVDPYEGNPYRPQSLNRYAYVLGSPINLTDPWGLNASACDGMQGPCPQPGYYDEIDLIGNFFDIGPRNGFNWFPSFPSWPAGGNDGGGGGGSIPTISAAPDPQKPTTPGGTPKDEAARCNALSRGLWGAGSTASLLQYGAGSWGFRVAVSPRAWGAYEFVQEIRLASVGKVFGGIATAVTVLNDVNNPSLGPGKLGLNMGFSWLGWKGGPTGAIASAIYGGIDNLYPGGWPAFGEKACHA